MSIMPDAWIRRMALEARMIEPFEPELVTQGVLSYGVSSYGYDLRLADEFKLPAAGLGPADVLDPKANVGGAFIALRAQFLDLAPQSFVLGQTLEYLRIPPDVLTLCVGKSSYARCGVLVNVTPFEPGWEGRATLCIANIGPRPVRLYAGEGIAQALFFQGEPCLVNYAQRQGKYQAQQQVTTARIG